MDHRAALLALSAVLLLVAGDTRPATGATLPIQGHRLGLRIGVLPPITIPGGDGIATLSAAGAFTVPASLFGPATKGAPITLLPFAPFSSLTVVGLANPTLAVSPGGAASGGLAGTAVINVLQLANLSIPLSVVGAPGASTVVSSLGVKLTVVGNGWTTGAQMLTGITTTTPGTAVLNTVTLSGSRQTTPYQGGGTVTLVTTFKVITGFAGVLPGFAEQQLVLVPEPLATMLLSAGAAFAAAVGWRRRRRR